MDIRTKAIYTKDALESLKNSNGWSILDSNLKDELESLNNFRRSSDDPNICLSCTKKIDGILFVYETMEHLIESSEQDILLNS